MLWVLIRSASESTHNICFCGDIRKIFSWIPRLSGVMSLLVQSDIFYCFPRQRVLYSSMCLAFICGSELSL